MEYGAMRRGAGRLWLFILLGRAVAIPAHEANLVIVGVRVWTGNPRQPWAEAIAIANERIMAVGSNAEVESLVGPSTRVIRAGDAMLIPGFIDAHTHTPSGKGPSFTPISLRFVRTKQKFIDRVAGYAAKAPAGTWLLGGEWDHRQWGGELPSRQWIDGVTRDNPVWLYHVDQEMALANSAALRAAGITRNSNENRVDGIVRDAFGEPTGIIKLTAMSLIDAAAEKPQREDDDRALDERMHRIAEQGITSVQSMTGWSDLLTLRRAHDSGRLRVRVYAVIGPVYTWKRLVEYTALNGRGDDWLRWVAMKGYALDWPESDPSFRRPIPGTAVSEPSVEDFYGWVAAASKAGLHILVHDGGGTRHLLGIFERVIREQSLSNPRFRIEHCFYISRSDAARFASLGVIGSLQPDLAFQYEDAEEFQNHLPYRLLQDAGAGIAFGSDQGIGSPLAGIALAVNHPIAAGRRMGVEEALRAYTSDAAYAAFEETEKGRLEAGMFADCVLLDRDIMRIPPQQIRETRIQLTVVGGKIAYERR